MLVLIAESKTMTACASTVTQDVYAAHTPAFEAEADAIMQSISGMTASELAAVAKISLPMAQRLRLMIHDFPNKSTGAKAIEAFTGVVFRALDCRSLSPAETRRLCGSAGIISSLYGWLRPDDIIKPYRLDFTTPLAPEGQRMAAYWRQNVTTAIIDHLRANSRGCVLNLMPGDAERSIDRQRVEREAEIWKAEFREIRPGGIVATPNANRLKTLRGTLLRQIVQENITSPRQLASIESDHYIAEMSSAEERTITFTTVAD